MHQNAPFRIRKYKKFYGGGAQPPPETPVPTPVGAFGASIRVPSVLEPPETTFWLQIFCLELRYI